MDAHSTDGIDTARRATVERRSDREIVVTPATYPQAEPTQEAASTPASAKQSKSAEPAKS